MAKPLLADAYRHPAMDFDSLLVSVKYDPCDLPLLMSFIPALKEKFDQINHSRDRHAYLSWVMGNLRPRAIGNVSLAELKAAIEKEVA
jgi:glutamyl-tRNA(Gln) amidotransferase subunit E